MLESDLFNNTNGTIIKNVICRFFLFSLFSSKITMNEGIREKKHQKHIKIPIIISSVLSKKNLMR